VNLGANLGSVKRQGIVLGFASAWAHGADEALHKKAHLRDRKSGNSPRNREPAQRPVAKAADLLRSSTLHRLLTHLSGTCESG
jgi:hypothetical protein